MEHQFNISIFWELTKYLSQETDFVVWYPMIKIFEYMSTIIPFSTIYELQYIDIKVITNKYYLTTNVKEYLIQNCYKIVQHFI